MRLSSLFLGMGLALAALPAHAAQSGPQPLAATGSVAWKKLDDAMDDALKSKRPVFVMVHAPWCGYCRKMDATTFRDPTIVRMLAAKFSSSRLDGESESTVRWPPRKAVTEAEIAQKVFGVSGFPTLLFLRSDRKVLARISSYLPADQMKMLLEAVLAFDASGQLDKGVDFDTWLERNPPKPD
jgi:thioredoxin-related protein